MKTTIMPLVNSVILEYKDDAKLKTILDALNSTGKVEVPVKVGATADKAKMGKCDIDPVKFMEEVEWAEEVYKEDKMDPWINGFRNALRTVLRKEE